MGDPSHPGRRRSARMPMADFSLAGKGAAATAAPKPEALAEAADAVRALGRRALAVSTNVRRMEELRNLVDTTRETLGRIDVLVNNAGTNPIFGPVQEMDERAWDMIMNTNVKSMFYLSVMAREAMCLHGEGGSIVNVSSIGGFQASDVIGGYSISKAAVIMLTQVLAKQWGRDGIRVNCIAPGLIRTEFSRALWENERISRDAGEGGGLPRPWGG